MRVVAGITKRRCLKSFIYVGVCKTPVHNILQKLLIIRLVNFGKGTSRTGKKRWQSVVMQK